MSNCRTVKVSNLSLGASERDVKEFFSFSGDIEYVEMRSDTERCQIVFVTFKDDQGAETAVLLSGATIVDMTVDITLDPDYKLPAAASAPPMSSEKIAGGGGESAFQKAEDVVSGMLAKGFILGKDAVNKAKSFDEKHQLTHSASVKVASFDQKIGLTEKISAGTSLVNTKVAVAVAFLVVAGSSYGQTSFVEEYITHTYFKKYDSLIDSKFDKFIANEIPLDLCLASRDGNCAMPTFSSPHRSVIGEGSHRSLSSSVALKLQPELKSILDAQFCKLVFIERLPTGVFVDPFELQHLIQRGVFTDAAVFGDTNLELPSFCSNQSVVEIHMSIAAKDDLDINLEIPLHARYQPLGHGYSRVEFGQPDWLLCCSPEANVHNMSCALIPSNRISDNKGIPVVWEIPCGIKEHAGVVSAVTFFSAIAAALLIILASVCYSDKSL